MTTNERIQRGVKRLPAALQGEVLDFVEYLLAKTQGRDDENGAWGEMSLSSAMRGMEEEASPSYTIADLKETFP